MCVPLLQVHQRSQSPLDAIKGRRGVCPLVAQLFKLSVALSVAKSAIWG